MQDTPRFSTEPSSPVTGVKGRVPGGDGWDLPEDYDRGGLTDNPRTQCDPDPPPPYPD